MTAGPEDRVTELRRLIGANDREIVEHVNARLRLVAELWELKAAGGINRVDRARERALRDELAQTNAGPLSDEGLDRLVTTLLALTKRELG